MDWTTLAATALGAFVGVGSTLLADRVRRHHDRADRTRQERRQIYVTVLTKYRLAYEDMREAALTRDGRERATAVRQAFRSSGCDEARESALLCAPREMADALEAVYATLRDLQDAFATGDPPLDSPAMQERRLKHAEAVWAARAAIRGDLEVTG
ncbi:hypothetical protein ACFV46_06135 [Streptomyces sp. NPDC059852]|uniref:hypothetical protein n=1 Tax=Streptomyces sp. NPDC059852 TaxID=3346972 RepID=UPI00364A3B31